MKTNLTVGAYIIHEDKLLLILHNKLQIWLPPRGHIEPNETPDQAVIREVKEEVNLDIELLQYKRLYTGRNVREECALPFYTNVHSVGDHDHFGLFYLCKAKDITHLEGNLNEIKGIRFFSLESLAVDFITEDIQAIGKYALELSKIQVKS
ncbi:MAG TPA: NUDIX domain-containing protein [Nanoarchaeota archaeon]|nr:NUDIX domain-containing protein [Candidatus Woesearchaeota archaeon]HIH15019.1 NUDIX domain-containing protein [Nanoarchaeota archaeon]HIH59375.1 NUDIX domain-containing protein [Nanoarchaeota archaeon]HII13886.1 NUDIX domain-containing protein [Nanoarchaeota archaeon]HIJ04644.1 NUDIX domain-containing protein [Nanoarchaeota archaeon]